MKRDAKRRKNSTKRDGDNGWQQPDMIFGPKSDGTYVVEFRTAAGETLAISIPPSEAAVVRYFQERMPYGLFVPDLQEPK